MRIIYTRTTTPTSVTQRLTVEPPPGLMAQTFSIENTVQGRPTLNMGSGDQHAVNAARETLYRDTVAHFQRETKKVTDAITQDFNSRH